MFGGGAADVLHGDSGNDYLNGGPGADAIFGDAGNDQIFSLDGVIDQIDGGAGFDRAKRDPGDPATGVEGVLA
jgi:Ca2+-binding RTX toxin-like protein